MKKIAKMKPRTRWIVGLILIMLMAMGGNNSPYPECFIVAAFYGLLFIAFVCLCVKYKYTPAAPERPAPSAAPSAPVSTVDTAAEPLPAPEPAPQPKPAPAPDPRQRFRTNIAGVTFKNDDGTERQRILKDLYVNGTDGELTFDLYDYKGKSAIAVLHNGRCIGNIPQHRVAEFLEIDEHCTVESGSLCVDRFHTNEDDLDDDTPKPETIYRADLTMTYKR